MLILLPTFMSMPADITVPDPESDPTTFIALAIIGGFVTILTTLISAYYGYQAQRNSREAKGEASQARGDAQDAKSATEELVSRTTTNHGNNIGQHVEKTSITVQELSGTVGDLAKLMAQIAARQSDTEQGQRDARDDSHKLQSVMNEVVKHVRKLHEVDEKLDQRITGLSGNIGDVTVTTAVSAEEMKRQLSESVVIPPAASHLDVCLRPDCTGRCGRSRHPLFDD